MKIRKTLKDLTPYRKKEGEWETRLDKNESPFGLPDQLKEKLLGRLEKVRLNRYPDTCSDHLRKKIANFHGLNKENVVVGNGSDQLISYAVNLFEGKNVLTTPPTFSMYEFYSNLNDLQVLKVPLRKNFELPVERVKARLQGTAVVFLCSPNNPTGNVFPREKIIDILDTGTPLLLDEAYGDFAEESNLDLIKDYKNLLVLRTFSKAFGLAAARVGYCLGHEKTIHYLLRVKPPYNLNSLSATAAELLLENYGLAERTVSQVIEERARIYEKFRHWSFPSEANFILMDLDAYEFLLERGIKVRSFPGRLSESIRVTIGKKEENDRLIKTLEDFLDERG